MEANETRSEMFGPRPDQSIGPCHEFPPESATSFTALLELPPNQAVELLHTPEEIHTFPVFAPPPPPLFSVVSSPENSPENSFSQMVKQEPLDSSPAISDTTFQTPSNKRKDREKKVKESNTKNKKAGKETSDEKLPYVHVRARRGQATDSHSLAERARREKINARMKLLQELVPGCNKISGTASVLDEIINHVQSLQHQVEFLSMRLAAVNPGIDINLDAFMAVENGSLVGSNYAGITTPSAWPEEQIRPQYQQLWQMYGFQQPVLVKEEDNSNFVVPETSLLSYDSSGNSAFCRQTI